MHSLCKALEKISWSMSRPISMSRLSSACRTSPAQRWPAFPHMMNQLRHPCFPASAPIHNPHRTIGQRTCKTGGIVATSGVLYGRALAKFLVPALILVLPLEARLGHCEQKNLILLDLGQHCLRAAARSIDTDDLVARTNPLIWAILIPNRDQTGFFTCGY